MVTLTRRWCGPALAALGLLMAAALALLPDLAQSTFAYWVLTSALAPERVMLLAGFGVAIALAGERMRAAALLLFIASMTAGFLAHSLIFAVIVDIPPDYFDLTGAVSALAVGLVLAAGGRGRPVLLPLAAIVAGLMQAIVTELNDATLGDPTIPLAGALIALWIVVPVWLTLRAFWQDWFVIASRILGSWLIAIGLLHGGALVAPQRPALPPPATEPASPTFPNAEPLFPEAQPNEEAAPGPRFKEPKLLPP